MTEVYFVYGICTEKQMKIGKDGNEYYSYPVFNTPKGINRYELDYENSEEIDGVIFGVEIASLNCHYWGAMEMSKVGEVTQEMKDLVNKFIKLNKDIPTIKDCKPEDFTSVFDGAEPKLWCVLKSERY